MLVDGFTGCNHFQTGGVANARFLPWLGPPTRTYLLTPLPLQDLKPYRRLHYSFHRPRCNAVAYPNNCTLKRGILQNIVELTHTQRPIVQSLVNATNDYLPVPAPRFLLTAAFKT